MRLPTRLPRRLVDRYVGLIAYGVPMALLIRSALGNMPCDVLHQGLAEHRQPVFEPVLVVRESSPTRHDPADREGVT